MYTGHIHAYNLNVHVSLIAIYYYYLVKGLDVSYKSNQAAIATYLQLERLQITEISFSQFWGLRR